MSALLDGHHRSQVAREGHRANNCNQTLDDVTINADSVTHSALSNTPLGSSTSKIVTMGSGAAFIANRISQTGSQPLRLGPIASTEVVRTVPGADLWRKTADQRNAKSAPRAVRTSPLPDPGPRQASGPTADSANFRIALVGARDDGRRRSRATPWWIARGIAGRAPTGLRPAVNPGA